MSVGRSFAYRLAPGSLTAFVDHAGDVLLRRIDMQTGTKPTFVISGIPGIGSNRQVGMSQRLLNI